MASHPVRLFEGQTTGGADRPVRTLSEGLNRVASRFGSLVLPHGMAIGAELPCQLRLHLLRQSVW